jgi:pimeloyl-ACP methyl ester carboxylesterase
MPPSVRQTGPTLAKANGIELCYDTFGDPGAPPLLLIMGLAAQMIAWEEDFCAGLASRGYWVIRFDNRDIGLSSKFPQHGTPNLMAMFAQMMLRKPAAAPYTLLDMARDAVGLLDALEIDRAHVVGASMGGAIAQEMAMHHSARLRTLTSIMSTTGDPGLPQASPEALAVLLAPPPIGRQDYLDRYVQSCAVLRGPGFPLDEGRDPERAVRTYERGLNPPGVGRQLAAILASGDRTEALRAVRTPTLVIHGDADPLVRVEGGKATAEAIPGAKLLLIKGMGHALPTSMWPQIIDAIAGHAR